MAEPTLVLEDVAKSFGAVAALRSGSLRVEPGTIHALVGENGAGKSTLVKIVAGVHRRDSGTFRLLGAEYSTEVLFSRETHFNGQHDDEVIYRAGPFTQSAPQPAQA
mgnify:CR=1 FL=1